MGTTPIYGFPYPDPSDLVANYPALGQELAEDIEAVLPTLGGVTKVAAQTFTAVASISINNCFTSAYRNYLILHDLVPSAAQEIVMRMRVGGTDTAGSSYTTQRSETSQSTAAGAVNSATDGFRIGYAPNSSQVSSLFMYRPQLTTNTNFLSTCLRDGGDGAVYIQTITGILRNTTAYDGFTIIPQTSGTITGTVQVYAFGL